MSMLEELIEFFPKVSVSRGRSYHDRGVVQINTMTPTRVRALVVGSKRYKVEVEHVDGDDFVYQCDCPYFADHGEPCKHIWATLLAAEGDDWIALTGDEDDDDPPPRLVKPLPVFRSIARQAKSRPEPRPEPWKRALIEVKEAMRYGSLRAAPPAWPAGREILYVIDAAPDPYRGGVPRQIVIETHVRE
ncbi:MAG: SWIM zinc finger family protein, partial [Planctomycetota bacterium]|nr:SWIM zinc finger family protein [Planctomycetota bacterium]